MTLIEKADHLAARAHEGQVRKEGGIPYITHPRAVAEILNAYNFPEQVIAAALVHDVLEDTTVTPEELRAELGDDVLRMVEELSYDKKLGWEAQREAYAEAVRAAPEGVKAISIADKIHNARSLVAAHAAAGPAVWQRFNRGKEKKLWFEDLMLNMFRETWQHPLVDEYAVLVEQMKALD